MRTYEEAVELAGRLLWHCDQSREVGQTAWAEYSKARYDGMLEAIAYIFGKPEGAVMLDTWEEADRGKVGDDARMAG